MKLIINIYFPHFKLRDDVSEESLLSIVLSMGMCK